MRDILFFGKTDPGRVRKKNEDIFLINEKKHFCLVADGIGGSKAGGIASKIFAQTVSDYFETIVDPMESEAPGLIKEIFLTANSNILNHAREHQECSGMGCTAELLLFFDNSYVLGHMGDSRTFRQRNKSFKQLTVDHSLVQEQISQGLITPEEAKKHSFKNIIVRAVGIEENPLLDIMKGEIITGDRFLLCSDGLTDMVETSQIEEVLKSSLEDDQNVEILVEKAKESLGKDNITVVIAKINA
ncbi:MAG: Stp1/IreP family PP2C-type Ser/Thr phosphatase [Desulfobacula sp.]|nr:Stp1/IreP family PP2C-type Ser/Thr phosphatase [Desulfobacula sp.]